MGVCAFYSVKCLKNILYTLQYSTWFCDVYVPKEYCRVANKPWTLWPRWPSFLSSVKMRGKKTSKKKNCFVRKSWQYTGAVPIFSAVANLPVEQKVGCVKKLFIQSNPFFLRARVPRVFKGEGDISPTPGIFLAKNVSVFSVNIILG